MPVLYLSKPFQRVLVIGNYGGKISTLQKLEATNDYDKYVINGGFSGDILEYRLLRKLISSGKFSYVADRNDYIRLIQDETSNEIKKWIQSLPNVVIINYASRPVIIFNGGLPTNNMKIEDLNNNLEVSFVASSWHQRYRGKLGYIISNQSNQVETQTSQYFAYSMCLRQNYSQEVDQIGLKKLICLDDDA